MKLSDLSAESLEKIKSVRWDRIIEKHEGPLRGDKKNAVVDFDGFHK